MERGLKSNYTLYWLYHGKDPQSQSIENSTLRAIQTYIKILIGWGCSSFKLVDESGKEYKISKFGNIADQEKDNG